MKIKKIMRFAAISAIIIVVAASCKKESNTLEEDNDNEIITTVELEFIEQGTTDTLTYKWEDLDGDGGNTPIIEEVMLAPGKIYNVEIKLLDKTKTPADDITQEVEEESKDHRFYFQPTSGSGIAVDNLNNDSNGIPVGINSRWTTTGASQGSVRITLRHYANGGKAADDLVDSGKSSTDADVSFDTKVE